MTNQEQQSVLTIVLMAAFADGNNDPTERAEVKRIADSLAQGSEINLAQILQDVRQ